MRITVLFFEEPGEGGGLEHDEVVEQVADALKQHEVSLLGISGDLRRLVDGLAEQDPELVFNLLETFADNTTQDVHVTAVLEMLGRPFTGTGLTGMALRQDKAVTKKLLAFHDVLCPQFAIFDEQSLEFAGKMSFPLFVKPLRGDASLGVDNGSLVTDYASLVKRIAFIHDDLNDAALVEEFIDGREFYISVLGNDPMEALPLVELDFSGLPAGMPHIYGWDAKFDESSAGFEGTNAVIATDLPPEIRHRITMTGLRAAQVMRVTDYARVDLRLARDGRPYVVEVNANPYLEGTAALALAALQAGLSHAGLVNRIVDIAAKRWELVERRRLAQLKVITGRTERKRTSKARKKAVKAEKPTGAESAPAKTPTSD